MAERDGVALLADLLRRSRLLAPGDLAALIREEAQCLGFGDAVVYVTDYGQERLVPLPPMPNDYPHHGGRPAAIDGSLAGRAYTRLQIVETDVGGQPRTFAPLLAGMERLGVLELIGPPAARSADTVRDLASLVALLLMSKGLHSDYLECARRLEPMSLAAEIQWGLLPPLTFGCSTVLISGLLEPCYEVGGDAFDYALDAGQVAVGIFDAMGHGVDASLLSSLAVGGYRNSRRIGLNLRDTYTEIDRVVSRHRGGEAFSTAILGQLELATGRFTWVNAGHFAPLLLRGGKVVKALESDPGLPLGLSGEAPVPSTQALEPGDRLLLFTDGIVEARSPAGELFGEERLIELVRKATASGYSAAEAMRRLKLEILRHQNGSLNDDATILSIEWRSPNIEEYGP
jgi:serine phosphatase RsbU (regulator of sigma subunit)